MGHRRANGDAPLARDAREPRPAVAPLAEPYLLGNGYAAFLSLYHVARPTRCATEKAA